MFINNIYRNVLFIEQTMDSCEHPQFWIVIEALMLITVIVFVAIHVHDGSQIAESPVFVIVASALISFLFFLLIVTITSFICQRHINPSEKWYWRRFYTSASNDTESVCGICLEDKYKSTVVALSCEHSYHTACISKCLQTQPEQKCPTCRRDLIPCSTKSIIRTILPQSKRKSNRNMDTNLDFV